MVMLTVAVSQAGALERCGVAGALALNTITSSVPLLIGSQSLLRWLPFPAFAFSMMLVSREPVGVPDVRQSR